MCGIIGYVGSREAKPLLLQGLRRLEYRGYDSAGIALWEDDRLDYVRAVGNLQNLVDHASPNASVSRHGLGHTRWATHGGVTEANAHPMCGCDPAKIAIVHNGIIENYRELKAELLADGHTFHSETDTEVIVHLLEREYDGDLAVALTRVYPQLEGHFTIVAIHHDNPDLLVGVRCETPLVVGLGEGENFLASNVAAFLSETRRAVFPDDGDVVEITPSTVRFLKDGVEVEHPEVKELDWDDEEAEKGGYETFMLKEIYEQPDAVRETIGDRVRGHQLMLEALGLTEMEVRNLRRIVIVAAGTSYHAGVVGRYIIEEWARVPVEPDIASEWIYRNPVLSKDTLVIGVSQSGESRATVTAVRLAREPHRVDRVARLTRLRDSDHERVLGEHRVAVDPLARDVGLDGHPRPLFDDVATDDAGVVRGARGDDHDAPQVAHLHLRQAERLEHQLVAADAISDRLAHRLRLLVDLLQHEGLVAALFGFFVVPVELFHLGMLDLDAVLDEADGGRRDLDDIAVVGERSAARLAQERGDVRREEVLALAETHDERRLAPDTDEQIGIV